MIQFENEHVIVFQSALYQTTSTLIKSSNAMILVDPTWLPLEIEEIRSKVNELIEHRKLYILFTHHDFDHIIAAGAFPKATTIASAAFANEIDKDKVLNEIKHFDAGYYIERNYPIIYPSIDIEIKEDMQTIMLGDMTCTFYLAPGHTKDGILAIVEPYAIFIAGDYLSNIEFPFIEDYDAYVQTIKKAKSINTSQMINILVPGHGQCTSSIEEINNRINDAEKYLIQLKNDEISDHELETKYSFYQAMKEIHDENQKKIKRGGCLISPENKTDLENE